MNMSRFIAAFVIGAVSLVAQGPGRGIPSLNERQSGALDRMNADLAAQQRTLSAARSAMIVVAYNLPRDDRSIRTKAEAVREAEITLANARVAEFAKLQGSSDRFSGEQTAALHGGPSPREQQVS